MADLDLGYRVCAYNREDHGGVHVHHPLDGPAIGRVAVDGPGEAEALVRRYRARHEVFDLDAFRQVVHAWRYGWKSD